MYTLHNSVSSNTMEPGEERIVIQEEIRPNENLIEPGGQPALSRGECIVGTIIGFISLFGIIMLIIDLCRTL